MSEVEGYEIGPELKRKAMETLQWLINGVHNATITEEQFNTGIDTLFMTASGLVPEKPGVFEGRFIDMITACQEEAQNAFPVVKRVLYNHEQGNFKAFRWQAGDNFITCTTCMKGTAPTINRLQFDTAAKASQAIARVADASSIKQLGYVEVCA